MRAGVGWRATLLGMLSLTGLACGDPCVDDGFGAREDCSAVSSAGNGSTSTPSPTSGADDGGPGSGDSGTGGVSLSAGSDSTGGDTTQGVVTVTDTDTGGPTTGLTTGETTTGFTTGETTGGGSSTGGTAVYCTDMDGDNFGDPGDCFDVDPMNPPPGTVPEVDATDCDDGDPSTFPGAAANEPGLCATDADGDGWGDAMPAAGVDAGTDCDDTDAATFPGAAPNDDPAACLNDDDDDDWGDATPPPGVTPGTDCDDEAAATAPGAAPNDDPVACLNDDDGDDWGDPMPGPGIVPGTDCDDTDAMIGPCTVSWCIDADGDTFGDPNMCVLGAPGMPPSVDHVDNDLDCDDTDPFTYPGAAEQEPALCATDADDDGWGDDTPAPGVDPGSDCDDSNANVFPGAAINEPGLCAIDGDGDGWGDDAPPPGVDPGSDCDDTNPAVFPGAGFNEAPPLNAECLLDADGDGFGDDNPGGGIPAGTDCDDSNPQTFPGAAELDAPPGACMNDDDLDGFGDDSPGPGIVPGIDCDDTDPMVTMCEIWCLDADNDGFGDPNDCMVAGGPPTVDHVNNFGDCLDTDPDVFPGAAANEPALCTADLDGDGWGTSSPPAGADAGSDCDDTDPFTFPGASPLETPPLDVACTTDVDGDDFGDATPAAGVTPGTDCVDTNAAIFPGAAFAEPGLCTFDGDGDGFGADDASTIDPAADDGTDCDDTDPNTYPGAAEQEPALCATDADGDGWGDWNPAPGVDPGFDCDDADALVERCAMLITQDGTANHPLDAGLVTALNNQGLTVLLGEDLLAVPADAAPASIVVLSETATSFQLGATWRDITLPVIVLEGLVWDDMNMSGAGITVNETQVQIVAPGHPIAAGLAGTVQFMLNDPGSGMFRASPQASAIAIASRVVNAAHVVVYAYDTGALMVGGFPAPGPRIGFGADVDGGAGANGQLDTDGLAMFEAAVAWSLP